jgi:hypothetical protein
MAECIRSSANIETERGTKVVNVKICPCGAMPKPNSTWTEVEKPPFWVEWSVNNSLNQGKT